MKIKYITNVRIPTSRAHGYAIMKMCEEFSKAGVETVLYIPEKNNTSDKRDPFEYYNLHKNFLIERIKSFDFLGWTPRFGRLFYWLDILSFYISAKHTIKLEKTDILYTRDYLATLFFRRHKNIVLELHDISSNNFLFKRAIKKVKLFFVLNNNLKKDLISLGVIADSIFISPSGVDLNNFNIKEDKEELRKRLNLPSDKKIILYTGQFYKWKGVDTLALTAKSLPEYIFAFVGGAEPEFSLFNKKYNYIKNILVFPFQERSRMPMFLGAADILVIPNSANSKISTYYTSPLKLFEYMAVKRPIVVSDLPSIREIMNEEECVFARPDDPTSFANAINKLLADPSLAQKISLNSYNKVSQYSWDKRAQNIIEKLNNLL